MKTITVGSTTIIIMPDDALMIIIDPTAIVYKCLRCLETRNVYLLKEHDDVPFMRMCTCASAKQDPITSIHLTSDLQPFDDEFAPFMTKVSNDDDDRRMKDVGV